MSDADALFDRAASQTVELANRLSESDPKADLWDIADGLLAGAVHYWLYTRQPCGDPRCEQCAPISTAEERLALLLQDVEQYARDSDYYHAPTDLNVGRA
ncbi:hypothetical protein [Ectothiorhodospira mobilis]|uniref:Uncharacterized protein n=1 Tax=Ectothiorhodospira mobilis TaxID=195064 RepID=A0A1I4QZL6_ECTMO|nr:hypothetical protein [Ectothiorhodospira mobilis]MBK1692402.1 hypothetical protein [Ectothiorhodospira mobilis]MCG5535944.1 hypothetical protein [Ectothiorhodospira mobilis]SFM45150.1 hypothetical protein SAMN05421721_1067 [Ectothiorhodospira mobilis]